VIIDAMPSQSLMGDVQMQQVVRPVHGASNNLHVHHSNPCTCECLVAMNLLLIGAHSHKIETMQAMHPQVFAQQGAQSY